MAFIDWLRKQHEESARNRALFEGRPRVAASQAWGGYQDRPGGQRLMVRQPSPPASVTLTEKDDGSRTKVTKWEPEKQLKATALPGSGAPLSGVPVASPPHFDRDRFTTRGMGGFTGGASMYDMARDPGWSGVPQARGAPAPRRVQPRVSDPMNTRPGTVGGSLHHPASIADVSNQRAMYHALRRPNPQVAHIPPIRGNIGATQSIGVADPDPRIRGMRPSIMNTGNWLDNLGERYTNWRQRMIEADRRRRQRGNY